MQVHYLFQLLEPCSKCYYIRNTNLYWCGYIKCQHNNHNYNNDVSFGATIARDGTARNLTFNTGTGTVSVTGNVGSGAALGI
jgi:hypothetical protein